MDTRSASLRLLVVVGLVSCGTDPPEVASEPELMNRLSAEEEAAGWILLFDGTTLEGWEDPHRETPPGDAWVVEDGCIKAVPVPRLREDLLTLESFTDFELLFEWKIAPGGNSGVKYLVQDRAVLVEGRTNPAAERFEDKVDYELIHRREDRSRLGPDDRIEEYLVAFEYQLIDNRGHPDALEGGDHTSGAIYGLVAPAVAAAKPVGEFNQSRILLRGNRAMHWLNGVPIVAVDLDSGAIQQGLERRWTRNSPVFHLLTDMPRRTTPIALQHHNDEVWYRNLKIRHLGREEQDGF